MLILKQDCSSQTKRKVLTKAYKTPFFNPQPGKKIEKKLKKIEKINNYIG